MNRVHLFFVLAAAALFACQSVPLPPAVKPAPEKASPSLYSTHLTAMPSPRSADPQAEEVIEAYLNAIGGRAALLAIQDRYETFRLVHHTPMGKVPAIFERYQKRPNRIREDLVLEAKVGNPNLRIVNSYDGTAFWTSISPSPVEAQMACMLVRDKYIDDFFMTWKEDGYSIRYLNSDGEVNNDACHVIDVFESTGNQEGRYFFSKNSHLLLEKHWMIYGEREPVQLQLQFADYHMVKGPKAHEKAIIFAFKRRQSSNGNANLEWESIDVRLNTGLGDDIFRRPPQRAFEGPAGHAQEETAKKEKGA